MIIKRVEELLMVQPTQVSKVSIKLLKQPAPTQ
jgi:hypothetical protein